MEPTFRLQFLYRSYVSPKVRTVDWEGPSSMRTDRSTNTQFSFPRVDDHPNNPFSPKPEFASQTIFPTPKSTTSTTPSRKKSFGTLQQPLEQTLQRLLTTAAPDVPSRAPVVITGISAGLPGRNRPVFGEDNLKRLVRGESFISPIK